MWKGLSASDALAVLSGAHQRHGSLEGNAPKCVECTSTLSNFKWSSLTGEQVETSTIAHVHMYVGECSRACVCLCVHAFAFAHILQSNWRI